MRRSKEQTKLHLFPAKTAPLSQLAASRDHLNAFAVGLVLVVNGLVYTRYGNYLPAT
jgi:hypothetical protein